MTTFIDGVETVECEECKGNGNYICSECGQDTAECDVCHGVGEVPKQQPPSSGREGDGGL